MSKTLKDAEVNHLRRLLAWIECEHGQSPEELVATVKEIAPAIGDLSDEAKQRLVASHEKAASVPKYIRQAVKMLRKSIADTEGEIVDAELIAEQESIDSQLAEGTKRLE
ncbi:hypothetical protein RYA05_02275 [Pseudomonas syringae pv. actinidiae]|nr:hypothetical protein [Pseudomonas syringae pv. actinidiae]